MQLPQQTGANPISILKLTYILYVYKFKTNSINLRLKNIQSIMKLIVFKMI